MSIIWAWNYLALLSFLRILTQSTAMKLDDQKVNEHLAKQLSWSEGQKQDEADEEVNEIIRKTDYTLVIIVTAVIILTAVGLFWFFRDSIWPNRWVP
jgi:hypothetical protein